LIHRFGATLGRAVVTPHGGDAEVPASTAPQPLWRLV
jgi:hypothetical protein